MVNFVVPKYSILYRKLLVINIVVSNKVFFGPQVAQFLIIPSTYFWTKMHTIQGPTVLLVMNYEII